jgi:hypothetical protein
LDLGVGGTFGGQPGAGGRGAAGFVATVVVFRAAPTSLTVRAKPVIRA